MNLLHIDSSILGEHSVSRQVTKAIVERLRSQEPELTVNYRDLAAEPLAHFSIAHVIAAQGASPETAETRSDVALSQAVLEEFLTADIVVLGAPMYNFALPTQLKAWIDRILVAGKTFRYGANGPEGLAGDKRIVVAVARGGFYAAGSPSAPAEHVETYLRTVFAFIGVERLEFVFADGVKIGPEQRVRALSDALGAASELKAA